MTHRIVAYHQAHGHGENFVPLDAVGREAPITHFLIAAIHIADDGTIVLNDHPYDDPYHDQLWEAVERMQARGVHVMAMVGGWAPGTTEKLDGDAFDTYYPKLRAFLREKGLDGIDIDVEQDMSLEGVIRLIDALRRDFGAGFIVALAPVATAMWGGKNLSGFDYRELERQRKDSIDFYLVQFYSGFARADDPDAYEKIFEEGVFDRDRIVLGMISDEGDHSFIDLEPVAQMVEELSAKHPDFGGVDTWELPVVDGVREPTWWANLFYDAMARGQSRAAQPEMHPQLLPAPHSMRELGGVLELPRRMAVSGPTDLADVVVELLATGTGLILCCGDDGLIRVRQRDGKAGSYSLSITDGIDIEAADGEGVANAVATLRQLMPDWVHAPAPLPSMAVSVPRVRVDDEPTHGWRGMHLDVSRHFVPLPYLYRFVDQLHMHKFNIFHLHLTDDQGWRFEVKKWPRLTTLGAVRAGTRFPHWPEHDGVPHGGFYTADQLKALVGYAKRRGVTIVPEVDVPGHVRAVLAAYPELGDGTGDNGVATEFGVFHEVLHLTDRTMEFLEDVFTELLEVFDSPIIHIGGDECPKEQWRANPDARRLAEERGLPDVDHLQSWLTAYLHAFLAERGRRMVGWDEILDDGAIPKDAVVMSWRGTEPGKRGLAAGHDVVMAPGDPLYFDHYQSKSAREHHTIWGHNTWQDVALFDPFEGVPAEQREHLLGVQGQLWSEYMVTPQRVEYQAWPRAAVLAEVAWNGPIAPAELAPRLRRHLLRLDASAVNYRPLDGPKPWQAGGTGRYQRQKGHAYDV